MILFFKVMGIEEFCGLSREEQFDDLLWEKVIHFEEYKLIA